MRRFLAHVVRAARALAGDRTIPRPLRWMLGLALLPIPGPVDEVVLVVVAPVLFAFHRPALRRAWRESA